MSKYTTELRFVCEMAAGMRESAGLSGAKEVMERAAPEIFGFEWPIFDEAYRLPLEMKILRHYYRREICSETVGAWKLLLEDRLNMEMPYFNQLYKSELLEFDPLYDLDYTDERTVKRDSNTDKTDSSEGSSTVHAQGTETSDVGTTANSKTSATNSDTSTRTDDLTAWDMYSDTPQGGLDGVRDENYLSEARKNTNTGTQETATSGSSTSETDSTGKTLGETDTVQDSTRTDTKSQTGNTKVLTVDDYLQHVKGKKGGTSYSRLLDEYRRTFLNIDKMVVESLEDLFFGLW